MLCIHNQYIGGAKGDPVEYYVGKETDCGARELINFWILFPQQAVREEMTDRTTAS